jgi:hypothetical protein
MRKVLAHWAKFLFAVFLLYVFTLESEDWSTVKAQQVPACILNLPYPVHAPWPAGITWHAGDDGYFFTDCDRVDAWHCDADWYAMDLNGSGSNGETNDQGMLVFSVSDGIVQYAGDKRNGYGYQVVINHKDNIQSRYAHLRDIPLVNTGDRITQGTPLGYVGSTGGTSTGSHLHYAVYFCDPNDIITDPDDGLQKCGDDNLLIYAAPPVPIADYITAISDGDQITSWNYGKT